MSGDAGAGRRTMSDLRWFIEETDAEIIDYDGDFTSSDPYDAAEWERRIPPEVTVEVDGRYL
jgi:hypothetical protein